MRDVTTNLLSRIERLEARLKALETTEPNTVDPVVTSPSADHPATESSSRRNLLRYGAVTLGAAAAAAIAVSPAEAADGGPVVIGAANTATETTRITASVGNGLHAISTNSGGGIGVLGQSGLVGVLGDTTASVSSGAGVQGWSVNAIGETPGVFGIAHSPNAAGVFGYNRRGGSAVRAEIPWTATSNAIALYAVNYSSYTGGDPGTGGFAIYGLSAKGHGLVGATAAAGAAAVVGATNGVADAYAATFFGPVVVGGDFTVVGGAKSAAVPHPDGSHRRLYFLESPESWFEDFGRGTLVCGEATVTLDPDFAAVVDASNYHVFLTAYDSESYLNVVDRSVKGFRVRANQAAEGTFSWRVVAKRKDIAAPRLATVDVPKAPTLPDVPALGHEPVPLPAHIPRRGAIPRRPDGKS